MNICQSCSMPIDNTSLAGTEADGTPSSTYCIYCYRRGKFIMPELQLHDMQLIVRDQMKKRHLPQTLIDTALNVLPSLQRWKTTAAGRQ